MPKTAAFDQFSDDYDQWFEENRDLYEAELEAIRQWSPQSVLWMMSANPFGRHAGY
jgi:hypothetical protein